MVTKPKEVNLRDFLTNSNLAVPKSPPWIHSTASNHLLPILEEEKLLAVKCNVFKGEKLCYLFVGRAAYKGKDALNPESWQLPSVAPRAVSVWKGELRRIDERAIGEGEGKRDVGICPSTRQAFVWR